jgi:aspartyl aminopeptidase
MEEQKTAGQQLAEKLSFELKDCWGTLSEAERVEINGFAGSYKRFIDKGKTEREFAAQCFEALEGAGFKDFETVLSRAETLQPGDKVYQNFKGKALVCAIIGKKPVKDGVNIIGAHIDSPRIDLKTNPLYEEAGFALFDTHYYGGIKHYQWTTIPLAMHGVVFGQDNVLRNICIGEDDEDPVFVITDLLPHLAQEQMKKTASEFIRGEELDILAGSEPYPDEKVKERVKLTVLKLLNEKYGMTEVDFAAAEIEFVPSHKARDVGFDRSLIGAYGHDDRSCAYAAFHAALQCEAAPEKTAICLLTDKEEIGSMGNTGAQSRLFENFISYLCAGNNAELDSRIALSRSSMLSADVNAAFDPAFDSVFDKKTASYCGKGLLLSKYTGRGGKFGGSDANAEFCQKVQRLLSKNGVQWQYGNLGKVDKGGGGTIAQYVANLGVEVLDCGIPVLSMHSPFEIISKVDLYTTFKGYAAFLRDA